MTDRVDTLFDEYAARWARGEHPDAAEYLEQAGEERQDLALLIDRYLSVAPAGEPDEQLVRFVAAVEAGDPPLVAARVARGLRRDEVVAGVMEQFAIPAEKESKVAGYWHELEVGLRRPRDVSAELWAEVVRVLGSLAEAARGWAPAAAAPGMAYLREQDWPTAAAENVTRYAAAPPASARAEPDEVDRLFGYGATRS